MDPDDFLFNSDFPIDKVLQTGEVTIVNDGNTSSMTAGYQRGKIVTSSAPNTTGQICSVRYVWSIDGTNWQSPSSHLWYSFTVSHPSGSSPMGAVQGAVAVGISTSSVHFRTLNGSHGAVSINSSGNASYTPISRTFRIKYALFARD